MVALVRLRAREHGVAMPLLASRDDLERLAGGEREASPLLEGWRRKMVGEELVELLDGELDAASRRRRCWSWRPRDDGSPTRR